MQYRSESSFSGPDGGTYDNTPVSRGHYRVAGDNVSLAFADGDSATATVYTRKQDGSIEAIQYSGKVLGPMFCD